MGSSVLFESADKGVVLVDIPRTLEEAQVPPGHVPKRRIYSAPPPEHPFHTPEPRDGASSESPAEQVADLMTGAAAENALQVLHTQYEGPKCTQRAIPPEAQEGVSLVTDAEHLLPVPPEAEYLCGSIHDLRQTFQDTAPKFDLIVLDPPWPNRSARRKTKGYATATTIEEIRQLLTLIPVSSHLQPEGLVAVWITNKPSIMNLMTSPTGVFASWGLELVAEWTWLKVTTSGEPLYDIESRWRKPWEKLLIARHTSTKLPSDIKAKIIIATPDVHSRKPNLRGLFEDVVGAGYKGLEVFARNLTAGWWSWGDEALLFQHAQHWLPKEL